MEPNIVLITLASIVGAVGIALLFVGILMAVLIALGNKQYIYGVAIFLFFPVGYFWCLKNRPQANYAATLLLSGGVLFALFFGLLWFELSRLGLDFWEVISTARPKH